MSPSRVPLVYGGGALGKVNSNGALIHTLPDCQAMFDIFVGRGYKIVDTSNIYGMGTSEELLGQLDPTSGLVIDTKVFPFTPDAFEPKNLRAAVQKSLKSLGPHGINVLYLHMPIRTIKLDDTLREINELYKEGLIKEFGLSNFMSWEVAEVYYIAKYNGWILPTVYQGLYNAIQRSVEDELMPCLHKYRIRFYAYSPLAHGLLGGRLQSITDMENSKGTRWDDKASPFASILRKAYSPLLPALAELKEALAKQGLQLSEVALRWLQHHSALTPQDGVVIGARNPEQLISNITHSEAGPLSDEVVRLIDHVCKEAKRDAPTYCH